MRKKQLLKTVFILLLLSFAFASKVFAQCPGPCDCPTICVDEFGNPYCWGCLEPNGGPAPCFTGDTPIRMADDSQKPIEDVKEGEMVKSFDPETGEITDSEVTKVYEHSKEETKGYYILTTESGKQIKVTPEHPILAEKTSETMSPLELTLLKIKAKIYKLFGKIP